MGPYHSALSSDLDLPELAAFEKDGSIVFEHDLTTGIPEVFHLAEAVYSEPSWRAGYVIFQERSKPSTESSFSDYVASIVDLVTALNKPTFLVIGKHMLKTLKPHSFLDIKLHKWDCILGLWNAFPKGFSTGIESNEAVIDYITTEYGVVADFSCGYGNMAAVALQKGKRFICSDINAKCVYYIAKNYMGFGDLSHKDITASHVK